LAIAVLLPYGRSFKSGVTIIYTLAAPGWLHGGSYVS
jgi:hypothetical protein